MLFIIFIICFNFIGNEKLFYYKCYFNKNVFVISVFYCIFYKFVYYKVNFIKKIDCLMNLLEYFVFIK